MLKIHITGDRAEGKTTLANFIKRSLGGLDIHCNSEASGVEEDLIIVGDSKCCRCKIKLFEKLRG